MAVTNIFNSVNISVNNTNSGVFIGQNSQTNWDSHQNRKPALGIVNGFSNFLGGNIVSYIDNDLIDTPISDPDLVPSANSQAL